MNQPMTIDYDHSQNLHSQTGPQSALPAIFPNQRPRSLLDVGCGLGTWLKAANEAGIPEVFGVDGIAVPPGKFMVSTSLFRQQNLTEIWNLGRRFEAVLCLEVAEHLDAQFARNLVHSLTLHSDTIIFGAACPGQGGQHHVNCQWPEYWQALFNERGFACADEVRWRIWKDNRIEPWYRQNIFTATKAPEAAGREPRILPVINPDMYKLMTEDNFRENAERIARGALPAAWYAKAFPQVFLNKLLQRSNESRK
jgi:SAM-dependent methyltransferase